MDIKKLAPWNWFKNEEEKTGKPIPVQHGQTREQGYPVVSPMYQLHQEIDRIFDHAFRGFGFAPLGGDRWFAPRLTDGILKPTLDISATDKEYTVTVEVPGVDQKDVQLELVNDTLTIRGEKKQEKEEKEKNYYCVERSYGSFKRVLSLPEDADQDNLHATFKKGVLSIRMPRKALPTAAVKRIEIKRE